MLKTKKSYNEVIECAFKKDFYPEFKQDAKEIIIQSKNGVSFPEIEILYIALGMPENLTIKEVLEWR